MKERRQESSLLDPSAKLKHSVSNSSTFDVQLPYRIPGPAADINLDGLGNTIELPGCRWAKSVSLVKKTLGTVHRHLIER
jgi:hypothetical protein